MITKRDVIINIWLLAIGIAYWLFPDSTEYVKVIAPLAALGISAGASLLGGLFGKRKPKLSKEQEFAKKQYMNLIANRGYQPGERELLTGKLQRELGTDLGLQGAIQGERLAGQGDTAFADAQRAQLSQAYADAVSKGITGLDIAGQQRAFQATQAMSGLQPTEMSKGNFFDVLGDVARPLTSVFAYKYGNQPSDQMPSAKAFKTNIAEENPEEMREMVDNLGVKSFNYKPGIGDGGMQRQIGLIADETPQPIATPDHQAINMQQLVMAMLGSIQSLSKEISLVREFAKTAKEVRKIEKMYS